MYALTRTATALAVASALTVAAHGQTPSSQVIPLKSKVFIATMDDGFDEHLKAAMQKKQVPLTIVENRSDAQFEITGHSETQKAGTAKKLLLGSWRSNEQASIQVANLETGEVAFAYSVNKKNSAHGKRSTAEACAKHLKEKIESGK
jgi:hypothetical protein